MVAMVVQQSMQALEQAHDIDIFVFLTALCTCAVKRSAHYCSAIVCSMQVEFLNALLNNTVLSGPASIHVLKFSSTKQQCFQQPELKAITWSCHAVAACRGQICLKAVRATGTKTRKKTSCKYQPMLLTRCLGESELIAELVPQTTKVGV